MAHDGAHRHDQKLLAPSVTSIPIERPAPSAEAPQNVCLDAAYDPPALSEEVAVLGFVPHIRSRGGELKEKARTPGWRARRWVVEACHSWVNRNRALLIRWSAFSLRSRSHFSSEPYNPRSHSGPWSVEVDVPIGQPVGLEGLHDAIIPGVVLAVLSGGSHWPSTSQSQLASAREKAIASSSTSKSAPPSSGMRSPHWAPGPWGRERSSRGRTPRWL
jgi:hypothetical protein